LLYSLGFDARHVACFTAAFVFHKILRLGFLVCSTLRAREWIRVLPDGKRLRVASAVAIALGKETARESFMQVAAVVL
jgi:hypothetical protein